MKLKNVATNGMRSTALAICALAIASAPTWAQATQDVPPQPPTQSDGSTPPAHPRMQHMQERHLETLTRQLSLTPDQVEQVKAINQDGMTQMMALRQDTATAPDDKHAKMKEIHDAQTAKIRAILTDDQRAKFDKMTAHQQERPEHRSGPDGDNRQPPPPPPAQ